MVKSCIAVLLMGMVACSVAHPLDKKATGQMATGAQATYLANEGVMVQSAEYKILFDPFFHNDFGYYQLVPESIRQAIFAGTAPYDNIDAVFISHAHEDHFSATDMHKFLQTHKKVHLYAPKQAVTQMTKMTIADEVMKRVTAIDIEYGAKPWVKTLGQLSIEAVRIPHAGGQARRYVQNMVFRVSLADDLSVMHMGDADANDKFFAFYDSFWQQKTTALSFPPYWFFESAEGKQILNSRINAKHHIGVHVPKNVPKGLAASGVMLFTIPGQTYQIAN